MQKLSQRDLTIDPTAATFTKDEIVDVVFADDDGELLSREGPNHYRSGDVLNGVAHDWVLQYAPGDYGVVENARFLRVYRLAK